MELLRALGSMIDAPSPKHAGVARALGLPEPPTSAEHHRVVASQRWPYASVYLGAEGMIGGVVRDRIAGFRRALGADDPRPAAEASARDASTNADHLAALLDLLAALERWSNAGGSVEAGSADSGGGPAPGAAQRALLTHARATLVREHVAPWLRVYLASFDDCGAPFYEAWAALLGRAIDAIEDELKDGVKPSAPLPAALRDAPGLPDPRRAGGDAFVAGLLAPVRSGIVLVRDDLTRLADDAGLACRAGERRYALAGLLAQDPGGTLARLSRRAEEWRDRLAGRGSARIAEWWSGRAEATARLLSQLAREAASPARQPASAELPAQPAMAAASEASR